MKTMIIKSDLIILPTGIFNGFIVSQNGVISTITKEEPRIKGDYIDATGLYVAPGFIDIHCHGGGGHDFIDGSMECLRQGALLHKKHGTTTLVPTALSAEIEEFFLFLDNFNKLKSNFVDGPYLPGVHLEGPYLNPAQAGAQDLKYLKLPCPDEYEKIIEYGEGAIIRWSAAPELPAALTFGDFISTHGAKPSIAHSDADYFEVLNARSHHYESITHLYSCMSSITRKNGYRSLGVTESAYVSDDLFVEVIADGHHLPPELLRLVYKGIGPSRIALITDAMRGAGMPEGKTILGSLKNGQEVIIENGVAKLPDKSAFAGSVATGDRLVYVMHKLVGIDIVDTITMAASTPAKMLGLEHKKGSIKIGLDGDLVIFDKDIDILQVILSRG